MFSNDIVTNEIYLDYKNKTHNYKTSGHIKLEKKIEQVLYQRRHTDSKHVHEKVFNIISYSGG